VRSECMEGHERRPGLKHIIKGRRRNKRGFPQ
jgi:hypothetical protein